MDAERLRERIADFLKGVRQLERAVAQPCDEFVRDATIQRYRNLTSHTYDERLANEVHAFIGQQALASFQALAREADTWRTP